MLARFMHCGVGKTTGPDAAFSNSSAWVELAPIVKWTMTLSTVTHSGECTVWIPLHSLITPAQTQVSSYGTATVNAGDHVVLQDIDEFGAGGGSPVIFGTVDYVNYQFDGTEQLMEIHFRNPMTYLADNYCRHGVPFTGSFVQPPYVNLNPPPPNTLAPPTSTFVYVPNYVSTQPDGRKPFSIITDLILELASPRVGGPFTSVNVANGVESDGALDGLNVFDDLDQSKLKLLDAILSLAQRTIWSNHAGVGHEVLATAVGTANGFTTQLFIFRRGWYFAQDDSGQNYSFVHGGGAGTNFIGIIDYNFPEQTFDVPTGAAVYGAGTNNLDGPTVWASLTAEGYNDVVTATVNVINRGAIDPADAANYLSAGRGFIDDNNAITDRTSAISAAAADLLTYGPNRGFRTGSIRVGGFIPNLFPGFLATIVIPEIGVDDIYVIDEWTYSEPEGITSITLNRRPGGTIEEQMTMLKKQSDKAISIVNKVADSGWCRSNGQPGHWDSTIPPSGGFKSALASVTPDPTYGSIFTFKHNLGVIPSSIQIFAGLIYDDQSDMNIPTVTKVPEHNYDPVQQQYYGYSPITYNNNTISVALDPWLCHSLVVSQVAGAQQGWLARDDSRIYIRMYVHP